MCIGYGEYALTKDPYNFETAEEYIAFYTPELLEKIRKDKKRCERIKYAKCDCRTRRNQVDYY